MPSYGLIQSENSLAGSNVRGMHIPDRAFPECACPNTDLV